MANPQVRDPDEERKRRRRFLWLIFIPLLCLVPVCLWFTSQAAGLGLMKDALPEGLQSGLFANYGTFEPGVFNPIDPNLIGTIQADQATAVAGSGIVEIIPFVPLIDLPGLTQIAAIASPTPSSIPTSTPRPTVIVPIIVLPSRTPTPVDTPIPTATTPPPPPPPPPPVVPTIQFSATSYTVTEGNTTVAVTVTLNTATTVPVSINYATSNLSAFASSDYTSASNTLTFNPGVVSQTFDVTILDDSDIESREEITLTLSSAVNGTLGTPNPSKIVITDDEANPGCTSNSGINIGNPDGVIGQVACSTTMIVDLTATGGIVVNSDTNYDFAFYENKTSATTVVPDVLTISIGQSATGPWYVIYDFGDGCNPAGSTDPFAVMWIRGFDCASTWPDPETDNSWTLTLGTEILSDGGIAIDVDNGSVPVGTYNFVAFYSSPTGDNDGGTDIDSFKIIDIAQP